MKKICLCCGRNRKIGKFGRMSRYPDGKNPYCRDCMKDKRHNYACTLVGRRKTEEAKKKWKKKNKKHYKDYNKKYYIKNKKRILYNKRAKENTECVLITEDSKRIDKKKINKDRSVYIVIDPKRK